MAIIILLLILGLCYLLFDVSQMRQRLEAVEKRLRHVEKLLHRQGVPSVSAPTAETLTPKPPETAVAPAVAEAAPPKTVEAEIAPPLPETVAAATPADSSNDAPRFRIKRTEPAIAPPPTPPETPKRVPSSVPRTTASEPAPNLVWAWFWRGNPLLKTGMALLFLGLAFLLRLAAEHVHFPIEMRYLGVAATGMAAVWLGGKLAHKRRAYGLAVQGFGMAVLYLTVLAALKLHQLLPAPVAFMLMSITVMAMAALAVRRDALALAHIAVAGGMAAPILVSDGSGNHILLFAYLALLNTGIALIAWFKSWRSLNLMGFAGTFLIGAVWGAQAYTREHFATTEPFLLYHTLLYTLVVWRFALHSQHDDIPAPDNDADWQTLWQHAARYGMQIGKVDVALLCATALTAFSLQYRMVADMPYGAAWSAFGFAVAYALAAWFAQRQSHSLQTPFSLLAAGFATLSIPLAFDGEWTTALWTIEAALVYGSGTRLRQPWLRMGALAVGMMATLMQFGSYNSSNVSEHTDILLTGDSWGVLWILASAAAVWAWRRHDTPADWEQRGRSAWFGLAGIHLMLLPLMLLPVTWALPVSAWLPVLWAVLRRRLGVMAEVLTAIGLLLCLLLCLIMAARFGDLTAWMMLTAAVPLAATAFVLHKQYRSEFGAGVAWWALLMSFTFGWYALIRLLPDVWATVLWFAVWLAAAVYLKWRQGIQITLVFPIVFTVLWLMYQHSVLLLLAATMLHGWILHAQKQRAATEIHGLGLVLFVWLWGMFIAETTAHSAWQISLMGLYAAAGLYLSAGYGTDLARWLRHNGEIYSQVGTLIFTALSTMWLFYANTVTPTAPVPYLPLLNPVFVLSALMCWIALRHTRLPQWCMGVAMWYALSAEVLRNGHFFGGVVWNLPDLLASFALQAALSVAWTTMGIALMVWGNRSAHRLRWQAGAVLLGVVVAKLFFVELADSGGIARIVSFIVVGLMMVAVGWFAPVPPPHSAEDED
ncbi:DUF2339 domain-containing protein [Conchiformibius steedae]|uniref:DUF2339 domain-containing protein n=1 Tax=Conchiformibius steedae TaxID=153493 RepID=A0A3P2A102_9NEIS|nr:DUF2339 domain-containing protein [Conchiformibius steedae]RRD88685.1 DUF2339 domain-containing protein [Conchiformibius steedae]